MISITLLEKTMFGPRSYLPSFPRNIGKRTTTYKTSAANLPNRVVRVNDPTIKAIRSKQANQPTNIANQEPNFGYPRYRVHAYNA